jgi:hypothetical protein
MTRTESFKTERLAAVLSLALKRSSIAVLQRPTIRDGAFGFLPPTTSQIGLVNGGISGPS